MPNHYKILGVDKTASKDTIREAYKSQVRKYHPDINPDPDAKEKCIKINVAYDVLSDPDKKAEYDLGIL